MKQRKYVIENFVECVPWEQIKAVMSGKDYKKFVRWMGGQTCVAGGVYKSDLERFILGLPVVD